MLLPSDLEKQMVMAVFGGLKRQRLRLRCTFVSGRYFEASATQPGWDERNMHSVQHQITHCSHGRFPLTAYRKLYTLSQCNLAVKHTCIVCFCLHIQHVPYTTSHQLYVPFWIHHHRKRLLHTIHEDKSPTYTLLRDTVYQCKVASCTLASLSLLFCFFTAVLKLHTKGLPWSGTCECSPITISTIPALPVTALPVTKGVHHKFSKYFQLVQRCSCTSTI